MILLHREALIWRGAGRIWLNSSSIQCSPAAHSAPARWHRGCTRVWNHHCFPHTHIAFLTPTTAAPGGSVPGSSPWGHSKAPQKALGCSASLTLCWWPWLCFPGQGSSELKQQHSHTSFQGEFILLTLTKYPGDWSLGPSWFYSNGQKRCL